MKGSVDELFSTLKDDHVNDELTAKFFLRFYSFRKGDAKTMLSAAKSAGYIHEQKNTLTEKGKSAFEDFKRKSAN